MSFPPRKPRHRSGRRWRAKLRQKSEREAAQAKLAAIEAKLAGAQNQGDRPQLTSGATAGPEASHDAPQPTQAAQGGSSGQVSQPAQAQPEATQVALFERQANTRSDSRLARRAILHRWRPKPEATEAVLTKGTVMALSEQAKLPEVVAVAKLHLDAHRQWIGDEHHDDRMDYYERALELRARAADLPTPPISINTEGGAVGVQIFLPSNDRDPLDEPLKELPAGT